MLPGEETAANFGVLMTRAYRITGTVSGIPSGAMVQLILNKIDGPRMENLLDLAESNRFEYQNVLPGTYVPMMLVVKGITSGQPDMQIVLLSPTIEVEKADVDGVELHGEPGGVIHGKFRLDTGDKFDWAQLSVHLLHQGRWPGVVLRHV